MRYTEIALQVLAAKECGIIKSNADFWKSFPCEDLLDKKISGNIRVAETKEKLTYELYNAEGGGIVCAFDTDFPTINSRVKNNSEKPFLLFYKGNLDLLNDQNSNVAVIGLTDPSLEIGERERAVVSKLVNKNLVIVSGLAKGCDTIAHETCLDNGGKTVAILPSPIEKVFPADNKALADRIVNNDGLLLSEYYKDPASRMEAMNRFIERDRLQAMFAKAVILIASYRKGEGDSGSRHAIAAAVKYGIERYAVFNEAIDKDNKQFGLNEDLVTAKTKTSAKILQPKSIDEISRLRNKGLRGNDKPQDYQQLSML